MEPLFTVFGQHSTGLLQIENKEFKCSIGRSGIALTKNEGDNATPAGEFFFEKFFIDQIVLAKQN
jgi:L,D-peptidoglycan transpeptidase YkuD (ErfK/YbiS/YcfS/YnhG family)